MAGRPQRRVVSPDAAGVLQRRGQKNEAAACAHSRAADLYEQFEVVQVTLAIIRAGLDLHQICSASFLQRPSAVHRAEGGSSLLQSADINAGDLVGGVGGVRVVNRFKVQQIDVSRHRVCSQGTAGFSHKWWMMISPIGLVVPSS